MKIAIAGCGIAGTAIGHLLATNGHEVTIFEQAAECQPVGAGIMLQPSGQAVLEQLGIKDVIADRSASLTGLEARLASGKPLISLKYSGLESGHSAWGVHRGLLFDQLLELCQASGVTIRTSSQVVDYSKNDDVAVVTEAGDREGGFDFLIATDGSKSRLRDVANIRYRAIEYSYAAMWATGPSESVTDRLYQVVDGTERLVGLLPIGEGSCSFFWGLPATDYPSLIRRDFEEWKSEVVGLCPLSEEILKSFTNFDDLTFATYRHVRMQRWHADGIIFLGDAAHPSSPHLGQGVNLALEDAVCFADALAATNDFGAACRQFEALRWRKVRYYQQLTHRLTPFFQSGSHLLGVGRNLCLPWFPRIPWVRRRMLRTLCGTQRGWF